MLRLGRWANRLAGSYLFRDGCPVTYSGNQSMGPAEKCWHKKDLEINRDVVNYIRSRRLSYFGHVVRMSPSRIPNIMLYGRVHGKRPVGRPRKRWFDNVRDDCKILGFTVEEADQLARDSPTQLTQALTLPTPTYAWAHSPHPKTYVSK